MGSGGRSSSACRTRFIVGEHDEPQPDVVLLRPGVDHYGSGHPLSEHVLLVIEVADTSLVVDREVKIPRYARFGIAEAWLVNLVQERVAIYRDPTPDGYGALHILGRGEQLTPLAFPDLDVAVDDVLA